jgi:tetratricopeptide (TPR) repeat protein
MDPTAPMSIEKRLPRPTLLVLSKASLACSIGSILLLGIIGSNAIAQSIVAPTEPLRLMPPKPLPSTSQGQWNQLPQEGVVLDSGSSDAFDAADPASPFQSPSNQASRFGTKIPRGLPDVNPSERSSLRSDLVSDSNSVFDPESDGLEVTGDTQDDGNKSKKTAKQRNEQQRRLVATFPRDFLLDASDPGLFQFLSDQWIPSRSSEGKESRSRIERAADAAWQELRPELLTKLQSCDSLLRKNSVHSARDEIRNGLTLLARKLDQLSGSAGDLTPRRSSIRRSMPHESALQHALREIDECTYSTPDQITQSLQTFSDLVPQATLNHPWAADLLYALGKTYERELEFAPKQQEVLREQSLGAYQAAVRIAPSRGYIANQLGYNFLHIGSLDEAAKALQQAIDAGPTPYSWRNLAELYRRRGLVREAQLADEQAEFLLSTEGVKPSSTDGLD